MGKLESKDFLVIPGYNALQYLKYTIESPTLTHDLLQIPEKSLK